MYTKFTVSVHGYQPLKFQVQRWRLILWKKQKQNKKHKKNNSANYKSYNFDNKLLHDFFVG